MFTHVVKCTGNYISVPSTPLEPLEVMVPVVIAKSEKSFIFTATKYLPVTPQKIKSIDSYIKNLKFEVVKGFVIYDVTVCQKVFYVYSDRVMMQSYCDVFGVYTDSQCKRFGGKSGYRVEIFCNSHDFDILEQVLINMRLQLLEYRNIAL